MFHELRKITGMVVVFNNLLKITQVLIICNKLLQNWVADLRMLGIRCASTSAARISGQT